MVKAHFIFLFTKYPLLQKSFAFKIPIFISRVCQLYHFNSHWYERGNNIRRLYFGGKEVRINEKFFIPD